MDAQNKIIGQQYVTTYPPLRKDPVDEQFPLNLSLNYERPGERIGNSDYIRIGDSSFPINPESIAVRQITQTEFQDVLRSPGGIVLSNGFAELEVRIELTFPDAASIFGMDDSIPAEDLQSPAYRMTDDGLYRRSPNIHSQSLAALVAQFNCTPILPVVNNFLNYTYGITTLALKTLVAETPLDQEGHPIPNVMKVVLVGMAFQHAIYCPHILQLDQAFIYPLQRWFWRQQYADRLPGEHWILNRGQVPMAFPPLTSNEAQALKSVNSTDLSKTIHYSHLTGCTGEFQFSLIDEAWIRQMKALRRAYEDLWNLTLTDTFKTRTPDEKNDIFTSLDKFRDNITAYMTESYARMVPFDMGSELTLGHISVSLNNTFSTVKVPNQEYPAYQHMGRADGVMTASFWATESGVSKLQQMVDSARSIARDVRYELVAGFVGFENELSSLFGISSVVFTNIHVASVEGTPHTYMVTMDMANFNRHQERLEILQKSADTSMGLTNRSGYLEGADQSITGRADLGYDSSDPQVRFWQRYFKQLDENAQNPGTPNQSAFDPQGRPLNAWFNMAYIQQAKEQLELLELYPDLRLPTYQRLEAALSNGEILPLGSPEASAQFMLLEMRRKYWSNFGRFVDPDFYIDYPNKNLGDAISNTAQIVDWTDTKAASSYIQTLLRIVKNNLEDPGFCHVDGSMRSYIQDFVDNEHFPDTGFYGQSIKSQTPPAPGTLDASTRTMDPMPPSPSADGKSYRQATFGFPSKDKASQSSIVHSTFREPPFAHTANGVTFQIPSGSDPNNSNEMTGSEMMSTFTEADIAAVTEYIYGKGTYVSAKKPVAVSSGLSQSDLAAIAQYAQSHPVKSSPASGLSQAEIIAQYAQSHPIEPPLLGNDTNTVGQANKTVTPILSEADLTAVAQYIYGTEATSTSLSSTDLAAVAAYAYHKGSFPTSAAPANPSSPTQGIDVVPGDMFPAVSETSGFDFQNSNTLGAGGVQSEQSLINQAIMAQHPQDFGIRVVDEYGRLMSILGDSIRYDKTGRLVQAYPSYVMQLIDEGPRMQWVKIFPNFWALQSVQSIDIIQDRRDPAHTAKVVIANNYGNISNYTQNQENLNAMASEVGFSSETFDGFKNLFNVNIGVKAAVTQIVEGAILQPIRSIFPEAHLFGSSVTDLVSNMRSRQGNSVLLQPGVRLHIRIGYGSNGLELPVLFNGRITDIAYGQQAEVIATGDGIELKKLINKAEDDTDVINRPSEVQAPGIVTGWEPRHLIVSLMSAHNGNDFDYSLLNAALWKPWKSFWYNMTDGAFFQSNSLGITHFGNPYLFNFWDWMNAGRPSISPVDGTWKSPDEGRAWDPALDGAKKLKLYDKAKQIVKQPRDNNPTLTNILNTNNSAVTALGREAQTLGLGTNTKDYTALPWTEDYKFGSAVVSRLGQNILHVISGIPDSFGETGENVYPIYTPFSLAMSRYGSSFNLRGWMDYLTDAQGPPPPLPDLTPGSDLGMGMPGVMFNMYTHNKTVWDIIEFASQCFPPYVAAVRPFEYRSTLFVGAPYWQTRYDYHRVSARDLGVQDPTNNGVTGDQFEHDTLYGYPYAYAVQPFMQAHFYSSDTTLLSNTIRAADEDTYSDVIAMWYEGQGYGIVSKGRPTPKPQRQTVDRNIMAALRKTSIVNTDYVGSDIGPTAASILGGFFIPGVVYAAKHLINTLGKIASFGHWDLLNMWGAEEVMRQCTRALLRDYQRLMYQGELLVLGDPTVKPYDVVHFTDRYSDMHGMVGVRRVTWHLGFDTGFVTSIEPDLLCEVKGETYLMSIWGWLGGYTATNLALRMGSKIALAAGRREFIRTMMANFGVKLVSNGSAVTKALARVSPTLAKMTLGGKPLEQWEPKLLSYQLRKMFLNQMAKIMSGEGRAASFLSKRGLYNSDQFTTTRAIFQEILKNVRAPLGEKAAMEIPEDQFYRLVDEIITKGVANMSDTNLVKDITRIFKQNVAGEKLAEDLDGVINRSAAQKILEDGLLRWIEAQRPSNLFSLLSKTAGSLGKAGTAAGDVLGDAALKLVAEGGVKAAAGRLATGALVDVLPDLLGAVVGGTLFGVGGIAGIAFTIVSAAVFTMISRAIDDQTSLQMTFLRYRGSEFQAGLNGHSQEISLLVQDDSDEDMSVTPEDFQQMMDNGQFQVRPLVKHILEVYEARGVSTGSDPGFQNTIADETGVPWGTIPATSPENPLQTVLSQKYTQAQRAAIAEQHVFSDTSGKRDIINGFVSDNVITLLDLLAKQGFNVLVSAVRNDHRMDAVGPGFWGGHSEGLALDITHVSLQGLQGLRPPAAANNAVGVEPAGTTGRKLIDTVGRWGFVDTIGVTTYYQALVNASKPGPISMHPLGWSANLAYDGNGSGPHIHIKVK